ncbi:hypothetical protein L3X38_037139 [Prunus dulcis]|uniref:Uncharacterized protein n=1 Tax=Prunus dulcis TaxID=3755 RepID=A0AAD4V4W4_PRUDU|nr:hypothetical protein L3X38_037139 [Prunus dulcis]
MDIAVSKAQMSEAKSVQSNPTKKMRFTSTSKKDPSSATFDEETKLTRGINTISRVVKFILPFANEKEKLKEPHQLYNFIKKLQWDAFVASRLSPYFEAMHSKQSQRREKCEYNHRLSQKGYAGLDDQLEEID